MAQRNEIISVYAAGVVQGIALVTFPAAGAIFTSAAHYNLSSTEYGGMFLPQAITAVTSALFGGKLIHRLGLKRVFLLGIIADLVAMGLLIISAFLMKQHQMAFGILLVATASMGIGFGLTVPAINTFAAQLFPQKVDKAILMLNALLGLGTALAPVFVAIFLGLGIWWGLPVVVAAMTIALLIFSARLPLQESIQATTQTKNQKTKLPSRFWIFAAFALTYGVCETMNGNWASIYMARELGASASLSSLALTIFWGAVTGGRLLFAAIEKWFSQNCTAVILPLAVAGAFVITALLPKTNPILGIVAFALAGLGCSALLPLTISFGQKQLATMSTSVAGGLIAFYQVGYGIAAFGVGPLQSWASLNFKTIYGGTTIIALAMFALSFFIVQKHQPKSALDFQPVQL